MSTEEFDDLLRRARENLTPEERRKLRQELTLETATENGTAGRKSLYDALNERGMIGSITDGPGDLSTNPKYMEGFGKDGCD